MKLDINAALKILGVESGCSLVDLKTKYRALVREWHPDLNQHRLKQATEQMQLINAAYDVLEGVVGQSKAQQRQWQEFKANMEQSWREKFRLAWRQAYQKACEDTSIYAGMHLNTAIEWCRRSYINPPPEWFQGVLFENTPEKREQYQRWLLGKAPNQRLREEWARKYFALEFGESQWVFYLPARKELLTA